VIWFIVLHWLLLGQYSVETVALADFKTINECQEAKAPLDKTIRATEGSSWELQKVECSTLDSDEKS
jgi:hypothetical protein